MRVEKHPLDHRYFIHRTGDVRSMAGTTKALSKPSPSLNSRAEREREGESPAPIPAEAGR